MSIKFRRSEMGPIFNGTLIRVDGAMARIAYVDGFGCKTTGWFLKEYIL